MKTLPVQHLRQRDFQDMEAQVLARFYDFIFGPLFRIAEPANLQIRKAARELTNSVNPSDLQALLTGIKTGRVQYQAGVFSGEFNAAIAKALRSVGAKLDHREGVYRLDPAAIPADVRNEAAFYQAGARQIHDEMLKKLAEIQQGLQDAVKRRPVDAGKTVSSVLQGFQETAKELEVMPELTEASKAALAKSYSDNMALWVQDFSADMIGELRVIVQDNAMAGCRFDRLVTQLQGRYEVSKSKAQFLARQETGLFMAGFRRQRFEEVGVRRYRWLTSHDQKVRPLPGAKNQSNDHRRLNGQIFRYDDPPVVDLNSGRRANPGQDFNCRCVDQPILEAAPAELTGAAA